MTKRATKTPIRKLLRDRSPLQSQVRAGLDALAKAHRNYLDQSVRTAFADSIDLDEAPRLGHDQDNRWDYLLGHAASDEVVAVEPHSAKQDQITKVIDKRKAALQQLREHLRDGARISKWLWVASGRVQFAATEKAKLRLDQNGIEFVGTRVMSRHLPAAASPVPTTPRARPKRSK